MWPVSYHYIRLAYGFSAKIVLNYCTSQTSVCKIVAESFYVVLAVTHDVNRTHELLLMVTFTCCILPTPSLFPEIKIGCVTFQKMTDLFVLNYILHSYQLIEWLHQRHAQFHFFWCTILSPYCLQTFYLAILICFNVKNPNCNEVTSNSSCESFVIPYLMSKDIFHWWSRRLALFHLCPEQFWSPFLCLYYVRFQCKIPALTTVPCFSFWNCSKQFFHNTI